MAEGFTRKFVFPNEFASTSPSGSSIPRFETKAVAEAYIRPLDEDFVELIDETEAGDEAGGFYHKTGNDGTDIPAHDHYATIDGKRFAYLSRTIKLNTLGKVPQTEIIARLAELNAKGGGELKIRDSHLITGSIAPATLTGDVVLDFGSTGEIATGSGINPRIFNLIGASDGILGLHRIAFVNPRIDVSAGTGGASGVNLGTNLSFTHFAKVKVHGGRLYAGEGYQSGHGDSGITTVNVTDTLIDGVSIIGFDDCGIYISGGTEAGTLQDGWTTRIVNSAIEYCGNGIASKRQYHDVIVQGNAFRYCNQAIISAGADTTQQPGRRMQILNNFIEKTQAHGITLSGPTKAIITANHIKDWGYAADGVTPGHATPIGIFLDGASEALIQGNRIEMVDWTPGGTSIGIRVGDDPDVFGTAYTGGKVSSSGNRFKNIDIGISEGMTHGNLWTNEYFDDVADISNLNLNSHLTYFTEEDKTRTTIAHTPDDFRNGVQSYAADILDDTAETFQLPTLNLNNFLITIGCDNIGFGFPNGTIWVRNSPASLVDVSLYTPTQITLTTGVLTGTTGTDTHTTLSIAGDHVFYIENRTGSTRRYSILVQPI